MKIEKDVKTRILKAALKEFSTYGFSGSRMERIASNAKINKAMLFYYFASKKNLYQKVVQEVFQRIFPLVMNLLSSHPSVEEFLEKLPGLYVEFASKNPQFLHLVMLELIQNPKNIVSVFMEFFKDHEKKGLPGPPQLIQLIERWHNEKLINEEDPMQFMLNIISLSLLSFLAKPFLESIFRISPKYSQMSLLGEEFNKKRIKSIVDLLKRGMLT